jgi:pimeloyl-ACP methyl ester carboxylesterase
MVHGWMDVGASFQFVVDALAEDRHVIAPDWRGFGLTTGPEVDNFWFPDYLADLDFLLDHYAGDTAIDLVGHSMGGNVVMQYAGVRPERIRRLVNLEGFGMPARRPDEAPARYGQWIDELKRLHRGEMALAGYSAVEGVARRLMKTNPRLTPDKANWLASHWSVNHGQPDGPERWQILGDPAHKIVNAHIFRVDETLALYARITAPLLMIEASDDSLHGWWKNRYTLDEFHERLKSVPAARIEQLGRRGPHAAPRPAAARGAPDRAVHRRLKAIRPVQPRARSLSRLAICAAA